MSTDGDAALARLLHSLVRDLLGWLSQYPDDRVDPKAVASIRRSIDWVIERLPDEQRHRLAAGDPDPASLETVTGLLVDLVWWLDTCDDNEVDPDVAVKLLEGGAADIDALPEGQRERLLEVLDQMTTSEQHDGRRYKLRCFPYEMGLVEEEPDDEEPSVREWVWPEARTTGSPPAE
ncbi:hypothetical protein AB0M46_27870 [Dactylosporangium sp. NPDC051485]|uniref:hypothetical protein n=1 Tax=Dactylosporangium sp. NPDC051485 TaxID=3154846 RepID=UPI003423741A